MTVTFADLGVPADIARRLDERGIDTPFEIQIATIPDALAGHDLCGKAPTGSGKTIAFGIPMVAAVKRSAPKRPKGLVLVPTRELAIQVADELTLLGDLRVLPVYGGAKIEPQIKKLRAGIDIVVACPGRLLDCIDRKALDLRDASFVVVDEADRMADMGFLPEVRRILDQTADKRQTLLFSATLDGAIDTLVQRYQHQPKIHEMEEAARGHIEHKFWIVNDRAAKVQVTAEVIERAGPTVVFSRTKHGADRIARQLAKLGVSAAAIHGNRSQPQRERALAAFHRGEVKALVATDVAARGIHVEGVRCVVHFDLPGDPKDYVHRSGRTGRAGEDGTVVALLPEPDRRDATKLARQAEIEVEITNPDVASIPPGFEAFSAAAAQRIVDNDQARAERQGGRSGGQGGNRSGGQRSGGGRPGGRGPGGARSGGRRDDSGDGRPARGGRPGGKPGGPKRGGPKSGGPKASGSKSGGAKAGGSKPGGRGPGGGSRPGAKRSGGGGSGAAGSGGGHRSGGRRG